MIPTAWRRLPIGSLRQAALHNVLAHRDISDPAVQAGIIRLFDREINDPKWEEWEEETPYENYYGELGDLCQKIATQYHNEAAWHAMIYSNYNEDSPWGLWLAAQPEAFPYIWSMAHSQTGFYAGRGTQLLAEALVRCYNPGTPNCAAPLAKRSEILALIRGRLMSPEDGISSAAIIALGVCGTGKDVEILRKTVDIMRDAPPTKAIPAESKRGMLWLINDSITKIQDRQAKPARASQ